MYKNFLQLSLFFYVIAFGLFDRAYFINLFYLSNIIFYIAFLLNEYTINRKILFKTNYVINLYLLFTLYCMLSCFWTIDPVESFNRCVTMLLISINILIAYNALKDKGFLSIIFAAIICVSFINFFIAIGLFGYNSVFYDGWRFQGTRDNPNYLAIFMFFSFFSSIFLSSKTFLKFNNLLHYLIFLNIPISIYNIFLTGSKKGIIFGSIVIILFFYYTLFYIKDRKSAINYIIIFVSLYVAQYFININDASLIYERISVRMSDFFYMEGLSTIQRLDFINYGFTIFKSNLFFGNGIGSFKSIFGTYSHNNFIEILSGVGLLGFCIYYSMYLYIFSKIRYIKNIHSKVVMLIFVLALLLMETSMVTYYYKFNIFMLVVVSVIVDFLSKEEYQN